LLANGPHARDPRSGPRPRHPTPRCTTPTELRRFLRDEFSQAADEPGLQISIVSFGFKHGVPAQADLVFDARFLQNSLFFEEGLKTKTGLDGEVVEFLEKVPEYGEFLRRLDDLLAFLLPGYVREGKSYLTVGVGCTGGRHRSVAVAESLRRTMQSRGWGRRVTPSRPRQGIERWLGTPGRDPWPALRRSSSPATRQIVGETPHMEAIALGWDEDQTQARRRIEEAIQRLDTGARNPDPHRFVRGTASNLSFCVPRSRTGRCGHRGEPPHGHQVHEPAGDRDHREAAVRIRDEGRKAIYAASEVLKKETGRGTA